MTINEALVLVKALRGRMNELREIRNVSLVSRRYLAGEEMREVVEPRYDMKTLDKMIVRIENFLLKLDAKIKQTNALTMLDGVSEEEAEKLMEPIED